MKNEKTSKNYLSRNNIWILRKKMGLNQKQLAYVIFQKSSSILNRWENGISKPDADSIVKLAIALSASIENIFPGKYECWQIPILKRRNEIIRGHGSCAEPEGINKIRTP